MKCKKAKKMVIGHLKMDAKTWLEISTKAKHEAQSDKKLIRKLKRVV